MKKFLKYLINYDFWKSYNSEKNLKKGLAIFFESESKGLQKLFLKNFSYPANMVEDPVRLNPETSQVYYIINFTSKELFLNEATLQAAFSQSLSILQVQLPIGVTEYMVPEIEGRIDESYSILITLTPSYEHLGYGNIFKALVKPFLITLILISIISIITYV